MLRKGDPRGFATIAFCDGDDRGVAAQHSPHDLMVRLAGLQYEATTGVPWSQQTSRPCQQCHRLFHGSLARCQQFLVKIQNTTTSAAATRCSTASVPITTRVVGSATDDAVTSSTASPTRAASSSLALVTPARRFFKRVLPQWAQTGGRTSVPSGERSSWSARTMGEAPSRVRTSSPQVAQDKSRERPLRLSTQITRPSPRSKPAIFSAEDPLWWGLHHDDQALQPAANRFAEQYGRAATTDPLSELPVTAPGN